MLLLLNIISRKKNNKSVAIFMPVLLRLQHNWGIYIVRYARLGVLQLFIAIYEPRK